MIKLRRQLTLFIEDKDSENIEQTRKQFNPEQYRLIKAHVTLCREDEVEPTEKVLQKLAALNHRFVTVNFGKPIQFSDGKGVLIPADGDNIQFHQLRKDILKRINDNPRKHEPHITLMHPRNSTCTDTIFEQLETINFPTQIVFKQISLIEQEDNNPWKILKVFDLREG